MRLLVAFAMAVLSVGACGRMPEPVGVTEDPVQFWIMSGRDPIPRVIPSSDPVWPADVAPPVAPARARSSRLDAAGIARKLGTPKKGLEPPNDCVPAGAGPRSAKGGNARARPACPEPAAAGPLPRK